MELVGKDSPCYVDEIQILGQAKAVFHCRLHPLTPFPPVACFCFVCSCFLLRIVVIFFRAVALEAGTVLTIRFHIFPHLLSITYSLSPTNNSVVVSPVKEQLYARSLPLVGSYGLPVGVSGLRIPQPDVRKAFRLCQF